MSLMIQQLHFHKPDGLSLSLMITISLPILISPLNFHIQIQRFSLFFCITFLQTACFNSTASSDSLHWLESTTCIPFVLQSSLFPTRNWRPPKCDSTPHAEESVWGWAVVPYRQGGFLMASCSSGGTISSQQGGGRKGGVVVAERKTQRETETGRRHSLDGKKRLIQLSPQRDDRAGAAWELL